MRRRYISSIITIVIVIVGVIYSSEIFDDSESLRSNQLDDNSTTSQLDCQNDSGECYSSVISEVVDGDTIHLTNGHSIRFTLVDSPEMNTELGVQSKSFLESICPVGKTVHVDEDDGQLQGSYGRVIGLVYCEDNLDQSLNQRIIENNHGRIYTKFCDSSEFGKEDWVIKYGC